nr:MAG TPA_asm: hypothetical protein [Caudoviricetes sp.]
MHTKVQNNQYKKHLFNTFCLNKLAESGYYLHSAFIPTNQANHYT